jgi:hypothetical protein
MRPAPPGENTPKPAVVESLKYSCLPSTLHVCLLAVNIVQHPDVTGVLGQGQHETILRKREGYRGDEFRNHLAGAVEGGNGEGISQRFASDGVEESDWAGS